MGLHQTMTIYGECVNTNARTKVTISAIDRSECELRPNSEIGCIEGRRELWIGAIGPLSITVEKHSARRYRARFDKPLDDRIIAHFATC